MNAGLSLAHVMLYGVTLKYIIKSMKAKRCYENMHNSSTALKYLHFKPLKYSGLNSA